MNEITNEWMNEIIGWKLIAIKKRQMQSNILSKRKQCQTKTLDSFGTVIIEYSSNIETPCDWKCSSWAQFFENNLENPADFCGN